VKTATTTAATMTTATTTDNKSIGSQYLAKYIRNIQQANEATAAQYEYRLSRFEKYIAMAYKEQQQQDQSAGEG
jgi:LDH2 family malate/lactate/ureidoglycolate dehydrogenase